MHGSLGGKTSNASTMLCGSLLELLFFFKICQMVMCFGDASKISNDFDAVYRVAR